MSPTETDYERVARWLDGEDLQLTGGQRALAEEIAADAARVGPALEVSLPSGALARVRARLAPARRRRLRPRWLRRVGVAAAAAVLVAAGVAVLSRFRGENGLSPRQYVESFLHVPSEELDARVELLAEEMADYRVELALGEAWPLETALQGLEEEIGQFEPGEYPPGDSGSEEDLDELSW